jgi:hypothetical protein
VGRTEANNREMRRESTVTKNTPGEVMRDDEAKALIATVDDPITGRLLSNAMFHFFRRYYEQQDRPVSDFDMLYFATLMRDIFSEHEVLRRILAGERVGAFFDCDNNNGE